MLESHGINGFARCVRRKITEPSSIWGGPFTLPFTVPDRSSTTLKICAVGFKRSSGTRGHHARTAVARAALPLRTRLDSASAIAPAIGLRYRPMNSELWQQEPDRWLLAHLLAAPSRSTRHRQGEWSRAARTSGGRACVGRTNDRTARSSASLHAGRRAERALPLPAGGRKKCARLENLRVPLFFTLQDR